MQRWALLLSAYTYQIQYRSTKAHANADGLSRVPLELPEESQTREEESRVQQLVTDLLQVKASEIARATRNDPQLSRLLRFGKNGWPRQVPEELVGFWRKKDELTTEGNRIMWGSRVVVPAKLRGEVLQEFHRGHPGIVRMKQLARSYVLWPGIDKQIEEVVKSCVPCQSQQNMAPRVPLQTWPWPSTPWERVHVDFLGPFLGKMIFVAVDAHSKWPEAQIMTTTTAAETIAVLRNVFARNGIPKQLVSDNGPQFRSEEFQQFMARNGVQHIQISPYHPASNGAAERFVQTIKYSAYRCNKLWPPSSCGTERLHTLPRESHHVRCSARGSSEPSWTFSCRMWSQRSKSNSLSIMTVTVSIESWKLARWYGHGISAKGLPGGGV